MSTVRKRISRVENHMDAAMETFIFQRKLLVFFIIFVGMPLVTLAAVCVGTTVIAVPIAFLLGWI